MNLSKPLIFTRLLTVWERLRTSFWFLPSLMAASAIVLSFGLVKLDSSLGADAVSEFGWVYTFGPEGARAILSAIASSMMTVAGLTFSITMLTLQLASSQFGPRLLRNFMRDRGNQIVLGTFIATFVYCLLVLRTVRGVEGSSFVPHLSVAAGVLLAIASLAVLIYFIHHVATGVRIETVLGNLAAEARAAVDRLYPERLGQGQPPKGTDIASVTVPEDFDRLALPIHAATSGYVQRVDDEALMRIATEHDLVVQIDARPGRFATERDSVLSAYPLERVSGDVADELLATLMIGLERTPYQDLEFSIRRIVEIAQRALSPGINDPTTALYCVDRIGEALERLAKRDLPAAQRFDQSGSLRILTKVGTLEDLACPAFAAVARYAMKDADVIRRLFEVMERVSSAAAPKTGGAITTLAKGIYLTSQDELRLTYDRAALDP